MTEYDETTCITAGELRTAGIAVPATIPDCGWVPRSSIKYGTAKASGDVAAGRLSVSIPIEFTVPFQWILVAVEVSESKRLAEDT